MYKGNYNFFDYKYNIIGYNGQDFGGPAQYIYLIISIILITILLYILRKYPKDKVLIIIRILTIFLIIFDIVKISWETYYDIQKFGSFNKNLLPFDTCSIIMLAGLFAGFFKGKLKEYGEAWIVTGSIVGGIGTMVHLNAFYYYPFLSFGAFYSMIWHFIMLFMGLLLIITNYVPLKYITIIKGFALHLLFSLIVIPIDFIYDYDFMMYKDLGGIPIFENVATNLTNNGMQFLNPILMIILYFIAFNIAFLVPVGIKKVINKFKRK